MSTFQAKGTTPNVDLTASDADVIKPYVADRLATATLPEVAFDPKREAALTAIS